MKLITRLSLIKWGKRMDEEQFFWMQDRADEWWSGYRCSFEVVSLSTWLKACEAFWRRKLTLADCNLPIKLDLYCIVCFIWRNTLDYIIYGWTNSKTSFRTWDIYFAFMLSLELCQHYNDMIFNFCSKHLSL